MVTMDPSPKQNNSASCQQDPMKLEVQSRELCDNRKNQHSLGGKRGGGGDLS